MKSSDIVINKRIPSNGIDVINYALQQANFGKSIRELIDNDTKILALYVPSDKKFLQLHHLAKEVISIQKPDDPSKETKVLHGDVLNSSNDRILTRCCLKLNDRAKTNRGLVNEYLNIHYINIFFCD